MATHSETAAQRLAISFELFEHGEQVMRGVLRRRHPGASERELEERLDAWRAERPPLPPELRERALPLRSGR